MSPFTSKRCSNRSSGMEKTVRVILTCVGGQYSYDLIRALRSAEDFRAVVVGVDANLTASGRHFVDHFVVVPMAGQDPDGYVQTLHQLCRTYRIDLVIPGSDAECRVLARHRESFPASGTVIAVQQAATVEYMTDKFQLLSFLASHRVEVGAYSAIPSAEHVPDALLALGYPNQRVVLKPRTSTGARGVLVVDARTRVASSSVTMDARGSGVCTDNELLRAIHNGVLTISNYVAMPFYAGNIYDVDCLAQHGSAMCVIPRLRLWDDPLSPVSQGCRIQMDERVIAYVRQLVGVLGIHGSCDFDIATDNLGNPRVLDASTRFSGSIGASFVAGANIPAQLVRILLNLPLAPCVPRDGSVLRPVTSFVLLPLGGVSTPVPECDAHAATVP